VYVCFLVCACFIQEYLKLRTAHVHSLKAAGDSPYPHKFVVTTSLTEFIETYQHINDGEQHSDIVSVAGKLTSSLIQGHFLFSLKCSLGFILLQRLAFYQ